MTEFLKKPKILLIEDDLFQAEAYQAKFMVNGYEMPIVRDRKQGLAKAKKEAPDLILLDLVLFGNREEGFKTIRDLKADPKTKDIPIIILTNLGLKFASRSLSLGAEDFLQKTRYLPSELVAKVEQFLKKKKLWPKPARREKILLIEDDDYLSQMYKTKFALAGFNLILAKDGEEGLAKAKKEKIDLVLLDLILPRLSGFEVLKKLKQGKKTKNVPIIAFTAILRSNLNPKQDKIVRKYADHYFEKAKELPQRAVEIAEEFLAKK